MKKYKIKLNKKKFRKRMFELFFVLILVIGGIIFIPHFFGQNQAETSRTTSVKSTTVSYVLRDSGGLKITEALNAIQTYFNTYYSSLGVLKTSDLTQYFDTTTTQGYASAQVNQSALDYMISYRSESVNDLGFADCTCGVTVTDSSKDGDTLTVELVADEQIQFAYLGGQTSSMCGVVHTFVLEKTDTGYLILSHEYEDSAYLKIEEAVDDYLEANASASNELIKQQIDQALSDMETTAINNLSLYETQRQAFNTNASAFALSLSVSKEYDREAAVAYANQWVGETEVIRNDDVWETYDYAGGNCNNYVSQCVYAGGIPMDVTGDEIWKWYNDTPDSTSAKSGRSPSWTQVGYFYDYCTENSGYGIAAEVANNLYSADIGDVIIMDWGDGWSHVVLITGVVKDENGNVVDYLIDSNTSDRKNYPLSAYGCVKMSAIRIAGSNK